MATSASKPEPMNATTHHPKVRTTLKFADTLFVAGGAVSGKMEMECKADKGLGISVIMVELFAIEEITSRDHSATQTFLHSRRVFQGPGLPPSNAVHPFPMPDEPVLPMNYHHARRGTTSFLFRFPLPETSPSSINFGSGVAQLRYEVRATVGVAYKGERRLVTDKKAVDVVEMYRDDPSRPEPEGIHVGENGKILMQGKVLGGMLVAGQPACVELLVKNHSTKKNTGLNVTLSRNLQLANLAPNEKPPLRLSDTLTSVAFQGPEFVIHPGVEGVANLVFDVPPQARSLRGGVRDGGEDGRTSQHLFEVRGTVTICLSLGFGSKDLYLELPVAIFNPAALPDPSYVPYLPDIRPYSPPGMPGDVYYSPYTSPPPPTMSPPLYNHGLPPASPPILPFVDQGRVWLPPLSPSPYTGNRPVYSPLPYPAYPAEHAAQYVSPARPSSAEPIASQTLYSSAPVLPPPSTAQQLLGATSTEQAEAERVEGKGERASRITHHLRLSSRARSVSPLSHKFAVPPAEGLSGLSLHVPAHAATSPHDGTMSPVGHASTSSDVASPRPMPSPKQTYTVDPFTHLTIGRSERVRTLERIAAETDEANKDMSSSVPDLTLERDKTLPPPPVPSQKGHLAAQPSVHLANIFAHPEDDDGGVAPPTPTLNALASPKAALGQLGGLDALEARLLAEVGTRKVEQGSDRPDVRTVLPIAIPKPDTFIDPNIDSAISSLSLPGLGVDERTERLSREAPTTALSDRGRPRVRDIGAGSKDEPPPKTESEKTRKKKSGQKVQGDPVKEKELQRLRKAAQGRVAAWLGSIDPETPPQPVTPLSAEATPERSQDRKSPIQSGPVVSQSPPRSTTVAQADNAESQPAGSESETPRASKLIEDKPNPRSSGFMPIRPRDDQASPPEGQKPSQPPRKAPKFVWPQRQADPEVRYDVRSARGGRGGKVTAVAAIWAQASDQKPAVSPPKSPPPPSKKLVDWSKTPLRAPLSPSPLSLSSESTSDSKPRTTPASPAAELAARRAKLAKSSSVPAVLSSSLATPMLSSTASLARPAPKLSPVVPTRPPVIQEIPEIKSNGADAKAAPKRELAFGQARLRELIKKYQG
ncbi:arrestin-N domain-containing protein [Phanerochaete sordida]|uniref:Arrestin-N domain-containing protein n=1 Tax=Phanerochaete sordida TaxID=48140 RepID=A0A9P3L8L9_9APHY|nr:arrestin-N domain-containing protein [Phanerochaete sordida]